MKALKETERGHKCRAAFLFFGATMLWSLGSDRACKMTRLLSLNAPRILLRLSLRRLTTITSSVHGDIFTLMTPLIVGYRAIFLHDAVISLYFRGVKLISKRNEIRCLSPSKDNFMLNDVTFQDLNYSFQEQLLQYFTIALF